MGKQPAESMLGEGDVGPVCQVLKGGNMGVVCGKLVRRREGPRIRGSPQGCRAGTYL